MLEASDYLPSSPLPLFFFSLLSSLFTKLNQSFKLVLLYASKLST